jgi:hypothetical protein
LEMTIWLQLPPQTQSLGDGPEGHCGALVRKWRAAEAQLGWPAACRRDSMHLSNSCASLN